MQRLRLVTLVFLFAFTAALTVHAQSNSGSLTGTVSDPTGAVIPTATVTIANPVTGYTRTTTSDATGQFRFFNIPFNPYRVTVSMTGFNTASQSVEVNSVVPVALPIHLAIQTSSTTITVESSADLVETDPTFHTDIDRTTINEMPLESASSSLSSLVTLSSPGVAADSNGLFHGLGDHAENSFSIDGQPITDQQSKVFSNQLPADAVQSLEVIDGAPPAEYGDKTSLVIVATTRSGQGITTPRGSISASYGSFGSTDVSANLAYGGKSWGNFIALGGLQSGRFLDPGEFAVMHDKGNEENLFDRIDYQFNPKNSFHTNLQYTRSWFQTPNAYDNLGAINGNGNGDTDQRSKIGTIDIAPTFTHVLSDNAVFNIGPYLRSDAFNYYPSKNPLADLGPIQQETAAQQRSLTNAGLHADISYAKGRHNAKFGGMYSQTFLRENNQLGLVDPTLNDPAGPNYNPILAPYDLTLGGHLYAWHGQTDVKQVALYAEDQIKAGNFMFNLGLRGDFYNGLAIQRQAEPRVGISYNLKPTNTVLRVSYARSQETPFNENLVLSTKGCLDPVLQAIFLTLGSCNPAPFNPGFRNELHAGLQQAFGKRFVLGGEYIWKYTHNAYDFSILGATPITFPIEWHNSKIPGFAIHGSVPETHGLSAFVVMSSVAARFFNPQIGGVGATVSTPGGLPFRIDHDEKFNQTTHLQYAMPFHKSLWYSFNWRYDSGLVAGSAPCIGNPNDPNSNCAGGPIALPGGGQGINLSGFTPDQEFQAGLVCDGVKATPTKGFTSCDVAGLTSKLINLPAPGTEDDDRNPPRIAPRNLFDMAVGEDNLFHAKDHPIGLRITAINVTNRYALYNFLSTFSGTHYVTPRALTAQFTYNF